MRWYDAADDSRRVAEERAAEVLAAGGGGPTTPTVQAELEELRVAAEKAVRGVSYRSEDKRWRVCLDDLRRPEADRRWVVWDARDPKRIVPLLWGVGSLRRALVLAEGLARLRVLRAGLTAWRGARALVRAVLDA